MNITKTHLDFWLEKNKPKWTKRMKKPFYPSFMPSINLIDAVVNANASLKSAKNEADIHNTLWLARSAQKRGELRLMLAKLSVEPGTIINPQKRAALCKKWLKKLEGGK